MNSVNQQLHRSRARALAAHLDLEERTDNLTAPLERDSPVQALEKRLTPEQIDELQRQARQSAAAAARLSAEGGANTATSARVASSAPAVSAARTTAEPHTWSFEDKFGRVTSSSAAVATTPAVSSAVTSARPSSAAAPSSAASSVRAVSSAPRSSVVAATSSAATPPTVLTVTRPVSTASSASSSAASSSASVGAANAGTESSGMSTGGIAGIVAGALVGLVVLGTLIGWLYRKNAARKYSSKAAPWSKIDDDDDITPFPANEKLIDGHHGSDDIYGVSPAPVIGSRRALAMARQNAFTPDGSFRPTSEYMVHQGGNRAGLGAGRNADTGAYPNHPMGIDSQGRPYNGQAGRVPIPNTYQGQYADSHLSPHGNSRQLVGSSPTSPHDYANDLVPMTLGRPAAPESYSDISQHEDFADMPSPLTPDSFGHMQDPNYTPRTATTMGEWGGDLRPLQTAQSQAGLGYGFPTAAPYAGGVASTMAGGAKRVSLTKTQGMNDALPYDTGRQSPTEYIRPPPAAASASTHALETPAPMPLPSFEPMSPLMTTFDLRRQSKPLAMYEDERSQQKRLYGEVASAAGVSEPITPLSGGSMTDSVGSSTAGNAYPTHERLPNLTVSAPQPYVHGQPLSPLEEMATPMSTDTDRPVPSSNTHGFVNEKNPFERTLLSASRPLPSAPAPPYSATSTTGASGFPSPAYPPPSPGNMSLPGSVTDSPRRWSGGAARGTRVSVFDENDAYGGI